MTSLADRTIDALRANHDDLAALLAGLSDEQLTAPSGASEWTLAQVASHLGSGAEISQASLQTARAEDAPPAPDFNQQVWDRWNAMAPREQATGFLEQNAALVAAFEALTAAERETLQIELGFAPAPLPISSIAGLRLSEAAQHGWDIHVALDPVAVVDPAAALILTEQFAGDLGFLLGFIGHADALSAPALVEIRGSGFGLVIGDGVSVTTTATDPTATFVGPLEAAVRLLGGRLKPGYTPADVEVVGAVSLDDLRRVFPGF